jgi:epoxyqueuosine reductase
MAPQGNAPLIPTRRAALIKQHAIALGFARAGVTDLTPMPHANAVSRWIARGMAGTMHYMERQVSQRLDPAKIVPGTSRAVVVTRNYYATDPPPMQNSGRVARYARGRDYHNALRGPLNELASYIRSLGSPSTVAKPYCDAGPVPERALAQRAGIGWIGKNTMLIDPAMGSFVFLATILTDLEIAVDLPFEADRCGSCQRCLEACPTRAFPEERVLDSRRCISYLTIEHRGSFDQTEAQLPGEWVFGCDVCQDVCPWNVKFAEPADDAVLEGDPALAWLDLHDLSVISDAEFERRYGRTALRRAGANGIRRNASLLRGSRRGQAGGTRPAAGLRRPDDRIDG